MHVYTNNWITGIREKGTEKYTIIPNPSWGYAADPFIIEKDGEVYIFAELFDQRLGRASLGYIKYKNGKFGKWIVTIKETYHLSYPYLLFINNDMYICPESCSNETVYFYKCKKFPDVWEKQEPFISNMDCSDTSLFESNGEIFGVTCLFHENPIKLLLFKYDKENNKAIFSQQNPVVSGGELARSGGQFLKQAGGWIRVSQDCSEEYGKSLVFTNFLLEWPCIKEDVIKRISVKDVKTNRKLNIQGIHTYNCSNNYEVMDFKIRGINLIPRIKKHIHLK